MLRRRIGEVRLRFARATADGATLYSVVTATDVAEALAASVLRKLGVREKQVRVAAVAAAEVPAGAAAAGAGSAVGAGLSSDGSSSFAISHIGEHAIEIEARPGLWCRLTVEVQSS